MQYTEQSTRKSNLIPFRRNGDRRKGNRHNGDRAKGSLELIIRTLRHAEREALAKDPRAAGAVVLGQLRLGMERAAQGCPFRPESWLELGRRIVAAGGRRL